MILKKLVNLILVFSMEFYTFFINSKDFLLNYDIFLLCIIKFDERSKRNPNVEIYNTCVLKCCCVLSSEC